MAEIFGLAEIRERKRALAAESEVYRQTLKLEVQNIRIYRLRAQRSLGLMRLANPLLLLAGSFLGSRLFGSKVRLRNAGKWSWLGLGLMAWRLYRSYGPLLQGLVAPYFRKRKAAAPAESETGASSF